MTILTEIAAQLPDNNAEQITPAILRQVLVDMVADYVAVAAATATADVAGLAPLASPAFTGNPTVPNQTLGDNSTKAANTAFVAAALAALVNSSPAALDTLKELADALGDDPNFATTMTNALALKAPLASPALSGTPTAPTASALNNSTALATTAYVDRQTRDKLTAARTYYVRPDGNDSNTGLVNSAGGAFLTIGKAMVVAGALDTASFQLTISVQAGTYNEQVVLPKMVGALLPILTGVGSTTIINPTAVNATCVLNDGAGVWIVQNLKMTATGSAGSGCMTAQNGGTIKQGGCEFGAAGTAGNHMFALAYGVISMIAPYTITGGAQCHFVTNGGTILTNGAAGTATGSGTFSFAFSFALSNRVGLILALGYSVTGGTITGQRYVIGANSVIDTGGGGANVFPGNVAGTAGTTGGQYV